AQAPVGGVVPVVVTAVAGPDVGQVREGVARSAGRRADHGGHVYVRGPGDTCRRRGQDRRVGQDRERQGVGIAELHRRGAREVGAEDDQGTAAGRGRAGERENGRGRRARGAVDELVCRGGRRRAASDRNGDVDRAGGVRRDDGRE